MREQALLSGHGGKEFGVEREPDTVADHGLVDGGRARRDSQPGRVKDVADSEFVVVRCANGRYLFVGLSRRRG